MSKIILQVEDLRTSFFTQQGEVKAVEGRARGTRHRAASGQMPLL
jgi:hypothetical protein